MKGKTKRIICTAHPHRQEDAVFFCFLFGFRSRQASLSMRSQRHLRKSAGHVRKGHTLPAQVVLGKLAAAADDTPGGLLHCFVVSKKKSAAAQADASREVDWSQAGVEVTIRPPARDHGTLPEVPKGYPKVPRALGLGTRVAGCNTKLDPM